MICPPLSVHRPSLDGGDIGFGVTKNARGLCEHNATTQKQIRSNSVVRVASFCPRLYQILRESKKTFPKLARIM